MRILIVLMGLMFLSCSLLNHSAKVKLKSLNSWHYQLQDYSFKNQSVWKKEQLFVLDPLELRKSPEIFKNISLKSVKLAYLSIGEAERYRDYFSSLNKDLILFENKNWPGNYKVKFWEEEWQKIILVKLENIIKAGFDGVYLDIVDAFYEIQPHKLRAAQMRDFLSRLRSFSQKLNSSFLIIQQNAPTLFDYLPVAERESYFSLVDGIAYEDCFFYGENDHDNSFQLQDFCLSSMKEFSKRGKFLLSVEYLKKPEKIELYFKKVEELIKRESFTHFLGLVASRPLNGKEYHYHAQ